MANSAITVRFKDVSEVKELLLRMRNCGNCKHCKRLKKYVHIGSPECTNHDLGTHYVAADELCDKWEMKDE